MSATEATSARSLFRGMATGSGLYLLPVLIQRFVSVFLLPITTRYLTPADYGVSDLLEQVATVLYILLGTSFSSALGYFYFQASTPAGRRPVVSTTIVGGALLGVLTGVVGYPFAEPVSRAVFGNADAAGYLRLLLVSMPFAFMLESLLAWLRVEDRARAFALASILRVALTIIGVIALVAWLQLRVWGVLITSVAVMAVVAVVLAIDWIRRTGVVFDAALFGRMARFSAPIGIAGIGMFIIHFGSRFVLPHYRGFADLGLFALASKVGMLIAVPYSSFHTWWSAQVYNVMRRADAEDVLARTITYVAAGIAFCGLGLTVFAGPLLVLLAAPAYQDAAMLVPAITVAYGLKSAGDFFRCLFLAAGRPAYDAVCTWTGAALCMAGYALFIPQYGMWGAVWATLATFFVIFILSVVWTWKLRPYRVEGKRLALIALAMAIPLAAYLAIPVHGVVTRFAWASVLSAAFPALLWLSGFFTRGERELLLSRLPR